MNKVEIGLATLYNGDAREAPLADGCADMIFTDPPYGHNNNNGDLIHRIEAAIPSRARRNSSGEVVTNTEARPIANDGAEANDLARWLFLNSQRFLKSGGCCCCCCCCGGGGGPDPQFARWSLWMDEAMEFCQMIVWDKGPIGMGWRYRRSYETVLVGFKPGKPMRWFDESDKIENIIRPGQSGIRKLIPAADDHPTPKPPALAAHFINLHSQRDDVVLDPFMGGGSTGVAAVEMGRRFIGCELDPKWFGLACQRIEAAQAQQRMFA